MSARWASCWKSAVTSPPHGGSSESRGQGVKGAVQVKAQGTALFCRAAQRHLPASCRVASATSGVGTAGGGGWKSRMTRWHCVQENEGSAAFPFPACEHTSPLETSGWEVGARRPVCLDVFLRCLQFVPVSKFKKKSAAFFFSQPPTSTTTTHPLQPRVFCWCPGSQGYSLSLVVEKQWRRLWLHSSPLLTGCKVSATANPLCAIAFLSDGYPLKIEPLLCFFSNACFFRVGRRTWLWDAERIPWFFSHVSCTFLFFLIASLNGVKILLHFITISFL